MGLLEVLMGRRILEELWLTVRAIAWILCLVGSRILLRIHGALCAAIALELWLARRTVRGARWLMDQGEQLLELERRR